jgi:hypothetical protein
MIVANAVFPVRSWRSSSSNLGASDVATGVGLLLLAVGALWVAGRYFPAEKKSRF